MTPANPHRARRLARQCFAIARSTSFAGERDAAIARGIALAERAGLPLAEFDIPGRSRPKSVSQYTAADVSELMRKFRAGEAASSSPASATAAFGEDLEQRRREVGATDAETIHEARFRNFYAQVAAAAERDRTRR